MESLTGSAKTAHTAGSRSGLLRSRASIPGNQVRASLRMASLHSLQKRRGAGRDLAVEL